MPALLFSRVPSRTFGEAWDGVPEPFLKIAAFAERRKLAWGACKGGAGMTVEGNRRNQRSIRVLPRVSVTALTNAFARVGSHPWGRG